jgi:hypothetical protein
MLAADALHYPRCVLDLRKSQFADGSNGKDWICHDNHRYFVCRQWGYIFEILWRPPTMTNDDGREMDRRELDLWIGRNLMGWRWINCIKGRPPILMPPEQWGEYLPKYLKKMTVEYDGNAPHRLPAYSTDMTAAMTVVEKLRERDIYLRLMAIDSGYAVVFEWGNDGAITKRAINISDVPRAICEAALEVTAK